MITAWTNDGSPYEREKTEALGFKLNERRDIRNGGLKGQQPQEGEEGQVYDFVGFVTNEEDDLMVVFPKHFAVREAEADAQLLFRVMNRHRQRRPDCYMGEKYGDLFLSNYPFAPFFGIYDYYRRFGLYVEARQQVRPGAGGKISWKETIRRGDLLPSGGRMILYPWYHTEKYLFSTFLTECMIFAIDYTIGKFGSFLGLFPTGHAFLETDYLRERESVAETLRRLKEQVFRDEILGLIDNLIAFYDQVKEGGSYYFKYYHFFSVWEDMVLQYLRKNFAGMEPGGMIFDKERAVGLPFQKKQFYPNRAVSEQYIEVDAYAASGDVQYLFDAKYYTKMNGLDYKQAVYHMFLHHRNQTTHSALLLPGEMSGSRLHFEMDPRLNPEWADMKIWEVCLDIREVMAQYQ